MAYSKKNSAISAELKSHSILPKTPDTHQVSLSTNFSKTLLTRKEAAQLLGVKEGTLAVWATNKRYNLRYYKVGRLSKYSLLDLEKFIQENQVGGGDA